MKATLAARCLDTSMPRTYILPRMSPRDPAAVSASMRQVRSEGTSPERTLRKALWRRGLRYRLHYRRLPGKPDIVFPREKVAVFVDGDFWHGNQWRLRGLSSLEDQFKDSPKGDYWIPKIRRNMIRDADATRTLEYEGWHVIRIWESDIKRSLDSCVHQVSQAIQRRRQEGRGF